MKRILSFLYTVASFLFSLAAGTNLFAYLLHYAHILGRPQLGKWYEPFHLVFWYFTIRVPGNRYQIAFITTLAVFALLSFIGFKIYARFKLNVLGIYGKSRWRKDNELRRDGHFLEGGAIVGQTKGARFRTNRKGEYRMLRAGKVIFDTLQNEIAHTLVVAPTRRGKGVSAVIPTLLTWKYSAVVYDVKSENFHFTSGWRDQFSFIYRFDPTDKHSFKWNPLLEISRDPTTMFKDAADIAEILTHPTGGTDTLSSESMHWVESAKNLITAAILYVMLENTEVNKSLNGVSSLLDSPGMPIRDVLGMMETCREPYVSHTARNMLNRHDPELSGVVSTATRFLSIFKDPIISFNTSWSDFHVRGICNSSSPCTLYICVSPESSQRLQPLTRLLLELISRKSSSSLDANKWPLLMMIDEFPSLGRLSFLAEMLSLAAGYKIKYMLISQSFNDIYRTYGERNSILDNCKIKAVLGVGTPQDAKLVCEYLGSYSINSKTVSQSGTLGTFIARSRSTSLRETERKLMTVDEVLTMPNDQFIFISSGKYPYLGKKIMYYIDSRFTARAKRPPLSKDRQIARTSVPPLVPILSPRNLVQRPNVGSSSKRLHNPYSWYDDLSEKTISELKDIFDSMSDPQNPASSDTFVEERISQFAAFSSRAAQDSPSEKSDQPGPTPLQDTSPSNSQDRSSDTPAPKHGAENVRAFKLHSPLS